MRIIRTHETHPNSVSDTNTREWTYNGLDCCVTYDIIDSLLEQLDETTSATYDFERNLQGPVLEMRIRGVLVDQARKLEVIDEFWERSERLESALNRIVFDGVGLASFNWRSPKDLCRLFYDELGIPPIRSGGAPTVDRDARDKLASYPIAIQLIKHINTLTELGDKISVLRTGVDNDGRIRTSYNIAGTSTGRFSSSLSEFGSGGNLQNVEESLRSIFISDPGHKFAKFDAKSGESFCVGAIEWNLFGDRTFLDACETGDPHTAVARIVWPSLGWTGDIIRDKEIAERPYFRHHSHRFMCKKIGHGLNYLGGAEEISEQTRVPLDVIGSFKPRYFAAFPAHAQWHDWTDTQLRRTGLLTTLTGRRRRFFKRRNEPKTLKEAIAYSPQGSLADIVNAALLKLWRLGTATIMMQDHDAITFMYPEADEDRVVPLLMQHLPQTIPLANGRTLTIPYDCEVGWNKSHYHKEKNPDGLRGWEGHDGRRRSPQVSIMDRLVQRIGSKLRQPRDLSKVDGDKHHFRRPGAKGLGADKLKSVPKPLRDDRGPSRRGKDQDHRPGKKISK